MDLLEKKMLPKFNQTDMELLKCLLKYPQARPLSYVVSFSKELKSKSYTTLKTRIDLLVASDIIEITKYRPIQLKIKDDKREIIYRLFMLKEELNV